MPYNKLLAQPTVDVYEDRVSTTHCHARVFTFRYGVDAPKKHQQHRVDWFFNDCQREVRDCVRFFQWQLKRPGISKSEQEAIQRAIDSDLRLIRKMDEHVSSSCTIA